MNRLLATLFCAAPMLSSQAAIWEIDLGGVAGEGLLGGNVIDSRGDSFATGREIGHNDIPGILYDDVENILEFHVGWGAHEVVNGTPMSGQYVSSAIYGPAEMHENAERALYTFDITSGYEPTLNDPLGRSGFVHARLKLVDLAGYTVAQQEADLLGSKLYFSIASTTFETGEIRGQLLAVVPEPEEYALVTGALLLGVGLLKRRKILQTGA